jgi:hypothetical protein
MDGLTLVYQEEFIIIVGMAGTQLLGIVDEAGIFVGWMGKEPAQ